MIKYIYHIHIEIYFLKIHFVYFRSLIVLSQSECTYRHFTCDKNDTSNQKPRIIFFTCEKNDTSNQKRRAVVFSRGKEISLRSDVLTL